MGAGLLRDNYCGIPHPEMGVGLIPHAKELFILNGFHICSASDLLRMPTKLIKQPANIPFRLKRHMRIIGENGKPCFPQSQLNLFKTLSHGDSPCVCSHTWQGYVGLLVHTCEKKKERRQPKEGPYNKHNLSRRVTSHTPLIPRWTHAGKRLDNFFLINPAIRSFYQSYYGNPLLREFPPPRREGAGFHPIFAAHSRRNWTTGAKSPTATLIGFAPFPFVRRKEIMSVSGSCAIVRLIVSTGEASSRR